jgi:citronellol/citronellal dehydrogenase
MGPTEVIAAGALEEIEAETAVILCAADPTTMTGRVVWTQPFTRELGRLD